MVEVVTGGSLVDDDVVGGGGGGGVEVVVGGAEVVSVIVAGGVVGSTDVRDVDVVAGVAVVDSVVETVDVSDMAAVAAAAARQRGGRDAERQEAARKGKERVAAGQKRAERVTGMCSVQHGIIIFKTYRWNSARTCSLPFAGWVRWLCGFVGWARGKRASRAAFSGNVRPRWPTPRADLDGSLHSLLAVTRRSLKGNVVAARRRSACSSWKSWLEAKRMGTPV